MDSRTNNVAVEENKEFDSLNPGQVQLNSLLLLFYRRSLRVKETSPGQHLYTEEPGKNVELTKPKHSHGLLARHCVLVGTVMKGPDLEFILSLLIIC